ncbi:beta-glucosidase [Plebeiibacterium sediminum]|uniref:Glycoside hydrolase family 3 C-terminal domain-containing protein n=1 Tax=Plebeiibacterium sediminum TaxID=2992112 RepID=A0AAE3SE95_9BACT|nr:glycoside hydrolase family 3 C-terminal domain-containing protein [Plebeiobacterium sediminum]MCW3785777.1 glycoside hydrolase family 3 C-terminal domain-containing protein [Plebeiobacterium sediminum]
MKHLLFITLLIFTFSISKAQEHEIQNKVEELMSQLTLEEKVSLCSGRDDWSTMPIERLDIPWIWMADGPHGVRRAPATNKAGYGDQHPATCFPTASALSATWNTDLIYKVGQALGEECQALGVNILLGPGVNIKRSVLGGRNFEFFSEDPVLSGELGAAYINGVQSQGVGTSLKHYVANNVETMRMYMNSNVDTRTLHEIYLTPFEIAVKKSQPWTVMACYNRVQGEYGTQSSYLLTDILKNDWGYKGIVISDWFAVVDRVKALKSGMHIEMPHPGNVNNEYLLQAIKDGALDEAVLDEAVKEILTIVLKAKSLQKKDADLKEKEHHAFARQVEVEAITLLKNNNEVLPLDKKKYKKIAIIGEFAQAPRYQGNGSSEVKPTQLDNALEIIKKEYGKGVSISYAKGYDLKNDNDFSLIEESKKIAQEADVALVFAGLPLHYESEGIDRKHIDMPASHNKLIKEVSKVQKNTIAVLTNGSAVAMPWVNDVEAILETWLGGQAGAGAVADVLFGKVNPSGKLGETFPAKLEDTPAAFNFPGEQGDVLYGERIFVGYRYYDEKRIEPLFPFGFGLSYTQFEYSDMKVSSKQITDKDELEVKVTVKNTGAVAGKEIIQLYVSDTQSTLQRPEKELKKFTKVELNPGESKEITFVLNSRDFSYYDGKREMWIAESGSFTISAAASSRDIRQTQTITLNSEQQIPLMVDEYTFVKELWDNPQTRALIKEYIPKWIGNFVPEGKTLDEANIPGFFLEHPLIKYPYITNNEITKEQVEELIKRCQPLTYKPAYKQFEEKENVSF